MKKITFEEFKKLLINTSDNCCNSCEREKYRSWENLNSSLDHLLKTLGEFEDADKYINKNGYTEYHPNGTNYWSKDAPVALQYYPYHESVIKRCLECKAIFLAYTEYAGHAPQNRIRWVRSGLVYYGE